MDQGTHLAPGRVLRGCGLRTRDGLMPGTAGAGAESPQRDAASNAVQPARKGVRVANRGGPAGEDEEGGLEDVLGVLVMPEDGPGGVEHDGPMPLDQRGERGLVPLGGESLEQDAVG